MFEWLTWLIENWIYIVAGGIIAWILLKIDNKNNTGRY